MSDNRRSFNTADVSAIVALTNEAVDPKRVYERVATIAAETCGFVLLTTLKYVESENVVERLHSTDEKSHPVGGRKPLDKLVESHGGNGLNDVFLAATRDDVRRAFYDHELIFSLGISAILNAPICHAGRRLGTLNFCGEEGTYGDPEIETAKILAGLLVPTLLLESGLVSDLRP